MRTSERDRFLDEPMIAVMGTEADDGRPHLTPVWYSWSGTRFSVVVSVRSTKYRHLRERPRFTLCVDNRSWPYRSVSAECDVASVTTQLEYPEDLASRYLSGEALKGLLSRYESMTWAVISASPVRWYGGS